MILYEHPLSSYAQKVKIALREKGIPFELSVPEDFGTGRVGTPFADANPRREVPVLLVEDATPIFDSPIILDYIEARFPDPPLLPADPLGRARARMTEAICDAQYEAVNWAWAEILWFGRATGELADQLRDVGRRDTRTLQRWLTDRLGSDDWFNGEGFGHADLAAAPMVNRSVHYGLGPPTGSPLARWHARVSARPAVAETFAEFDAAAARISSMPNLYTTGGRRREYRDHRLEWMVRSGGVDIVLAGLQDGNIRFSWPGDPETS